MELELKYAYLADENERGEATEYFLNQFGEGTEQSLKFSIGPYHDPEATQIIEEYMDSRFDISQIETVSELTTKRKWLFKSVSTNSFNTTATLSKIKVNEDSMLAIANAMYDIILAFDTAVNVDKVA